MKKLFFIILLSAILFSCEKEATNIDLPSTKSKLVIGCFLSPDDKTIYVSITASSPIFGQNPNGNSVGVIPNASITLSDGNTIAPLAYDAANEIYKINASLFPIISGNTYTISASASGYDNVSGNCTVPISIVSSASAYITTGNDFAKKLRIKWQDISLEKNYYKIKIKYVCIDSTINDTVYIDRSSFYFGDSKEKTTFSDNGYEGKELYAEFEAIHSIGNVMYGFYNNTYILKSYQIEILNLEINYYNYQYSVENYSAEDPFSEASFIYTNIDKGLGVMGAYNPYKFAVN